MNRRDLIIGFLVGLSICLAANLVAVHLRSDGGLAEGLGIRNRVMDDIRRIGFPLQFFEEGGFRHRRIFNPRALVLDTLVALAFSTGIAFAYGWCRKIFSER